MYYDSNHKKPDGPIDHAAILSHPTLTDRAKVFALALAHVDQGHHGWSYKDPVKMGAGRLLAWNERKMERAGKELRAAGWMPTYGYNADKLPRVELPSEDADPAEAE